MMGREEVINFLEENLSGLDAALKRGDQKMADVHSRGYIEAITEYREFLPQEEVQELDSRYREIINGD